MATVEYNFFSKTELPVDAEWPDMGWDVFISAFNSSERVNLTYERAPAASKYWVLHNEYGYKTADHPVGTVYSNSSEDEATYIRALIQTIETDLRRPMGELSLCVDITGFMRPHLLFLVLYLERLGIKQYDVLYSEPEQYARKEKTTFSEGSLRVRQVAGFEGLNSPDQDTDLLIIGAGYDHRLIKAVAERKDKADKVQLFGLPSLRADMYQENVLRALNASDAIGTNKTFDLDRYFAPANDPFATAGALSEIVSYRTRQGEISNLYLSPLATKPQALGFALFYLGECKGKNASIIFPISTEYSRETSTGLSRVWRYTIEYPVIVQ